MSIAQVSAGLRLSPVDKVAIAVRQTLAGGGKGRLAAWTEGRIRRAVILAVPRAIPTPSIIVSTLAPNVVQEVGCVNVTVPILITAVWSEPLGWLEDDIGGAETVFVEIERVLMANYWLKVPQFGENRLVESFSEFRSHGEAHFIEQQNAVIVFQSIVAEYVLSLDAFTRELQEES